MMRQWTSKLINPDDPNDWVVECFDEHPAYCQCQACVTITYEGLDNGQLSLQFEQHTPGAIAGRS